MQTVKKIYFVANARMPSEKANGIHIAKMCEAFMQNGHNVTLVVPSRASGASLQEFYGLRVDVPVRRLPSVVLREYERLGFVVMGVSFMISTLIFLWSKKLQGERFVIYTADIDSFSHTLLPLAGKVVAEMHSPKGSTILARFFFRRSKIITTNPLIAAEIKKIFGIESLVEPNGVDEAFFGLEGSGGGALYVGRFYKWKGLEVLAQTGVPIHMLGGTKAEFERVFGKAGSLQFCEVQPHEVPHAMAAADVLLLIGTAKNEGSNRYTAPMKVFEYLATGKPIVASATEALQSIVPATLVRYCPPDDPQALARAISGALAAPGEGEARMAFAREHTWRKRAERIAVLL
ncbi:MAG: glycosyltransferase [Patescibacteria group bacterium]